MRISLIMVFAMFGIFLTFAVYGIVTFDLSIQEMKKLLGTRNEVFAFNMMQDLDKYIDKRLNDFKELTKAAVVQESLKKSNLEFRKLDNLETLLEQNKTDTDVKSEPFIQQITKNVGLYIGEIKYREEYGNYATEIGFRIDDEGGHFLGVLRVVLTLDDLIHEFINDAELINLPNRIGVLLDSHGRVIYSHGVQD